MTHRPHAVALSLLFAVLISPQPAPAVEVTTRPTTGPALEWLRREKTHLDRVTNRLKKHPQLVRNFYVRLELAVAERFIDRLTSGKSSGDDSDEWRKLQTDEIQLVLDHTERTIDLVEAGKLPPGGLGPVPVPTGGPVKVERGVFLAETIVPGVDEKPTMRPFYFGGFGHFGQIVEDLPNFADLGVTLVQDGRNGPDQGLKPDRSLTPAGEDIKATLQKAAKANVKVDILTSPHYFPGWAVAEAPDMQNGLPYHNVDHPKQREVIEAWLTHVGQLAKNEPALLSFCLSNEAIYGVSGRDPHSLPAWHAFLRERHKTIDALNAVYESSYKSFEEVQPGGWSETSVGRRHAFDRVTFNDRHFAQWHRWMGDALKRQRPDALTHAKIMVFFTLDPDKLGWGVDPEQFCLATDLAGCDAYAQMFAGVGPLDETTSKEYAYHWQVQQMFYDLLHSFRGQPVFNSENHPMPNASGAYRFPPAQTRAAMWQGGLHHQGATTTWAWEEASHDSLLHTIYFRPAHVWAHGRAFLDLNRLSAEVTAINRAPARVAMLYSPASRFWEPGYGVAIRTLYTALLFSGEKVTFVSERQLAEGGVPEHVEAVLLPRATSVAASTIDALSTFMAQGGRVIAAGEQNLAHDEYRRPRELPAALRDLPTIAIGTERETAAALRTVMPEAKRSKVALLAGDASAWGVEFRAVEHHGALLVPMINFLTKPQTVTLTVDGAAVGDALDLLSGGSVSADSLTLEPMEPLLLRVGRR